MTKRIEVVEPTPLPTIWWCPDCGRYCWPGLQPDKWAGSAKERAVPDA